MPWNESRWGGGDGSGGGGGGGGGSGDGGGSDGCRDERSREGDMVASFPARGSDSGVDATRGKVCVRRQLRVEIQV